MDRLLEIRSAERESHLQCYTENELYAIGSWLARPVKTVLDIIPLFSDYRQFSALDLGSGVGRNSIALALAFRDISCSIDCVDILDYAVERLLGNARKHNVQHVIHGIVESIDNFSIEFERYDLILAISALEHVASAAILKQKLYQIRNGVRPGGVVCLIMNSGVQECSKIDGSLIPPQFEVNLPTDVLVALLNQMFIDWDILKQTVVHQCYDIPRGGLTAELETDVVTFVTRKTR